MKRFFKKAVSFVLCATLVLSAFYTCALSCRTESCEGIGITEYIESSKAKTGTAARALEISKASFAKFINFISNFLLNGVLLKLIADYLPATDYVIDAETFDLDSYGNFYEGTADFLDEPAAGAAWNLGYAEESVLPADFGKPFTYARGSYVPWWYSTEIYKDEDGNDEDLRVRTVVLNDGTGRGSVAFCVIDCIGISNYDIRLIREAVADFAEANSIVSINVSATHTHSGIDSQGVWTAPLSTLGNNYLASETSAVSAVTGINDTFLDTVIESTANSIIAAYNDLTEGTLNYSVADISDYTRDRTPPYSYDGNLYKLEFLPTDTVKTPTIIASFGCHPESSSYDWLVTDDGVETDSKVSADFIYYMEKVINRAGCNFIYIQGDVGTVTSSRSLTDDGIDGLTAHDGAMRFGYELGYITLGISLTYDECIALNASTGDLLGVERYGSSEDYTPWYDGHTTASAAQVEPMLNIRMEQLMLEVENNMAKILTKTSLADNQLVYDSKKDVYYAITEIGYMEIGDTLKVLLNPGETFNEIVLGGDQLNGFEYPSLRELIGENVIVFDLMNDAIGYISPDNNYVIAGYQYDAEKDSLESDTWCLLVSMGAETASTLVEEYVKLVNTVA